ncbi:MAG: M20 family metallopeptidase [Reyranella sp.]|uniref:M20 family metallopeptidase n=1 Tax=Reyranella sp. TaxID=1929291 RepID=UPI003D10D98F
MTDSARSNIPTFDGEEILAGIRRWVEIETPSHDGVAVNKLVDVVQSDLTRIGAQTLRTPGRDGFGDILEARAPWGDENEPGILIVGHLDTVHPIGALATTHVFRREGDTVYGPGIYDMKAGSYLACYALQHFVREGRRTTLPVRILYVPEEEVGSPTSRAAIEAAARKSKYVLVMEPARDGGKCVTARKGWGRFDMTITGRASHAGSRPQDGRSALRELARQILDLEAMSDPAVGISIVVGMAQGGSAPNVVPALATATIDLRVPPGIDADAVVQRVLQRPAFDPDCRVEVTGGINRPAYAKNEGITALFEHAKGCAAEIGFVLEDTPLTGGVSDGNFPAALGIPTLDGLGADGRGAHALDEQISFASLVPRAQLLVRMLETLR